MTIATATEQGVETHVNGSLDLRSMSIGWLFIAPIVFAITAATAYRPSFDTPYQSVLAVLPVVVFGATLIALLTPLCNIRPTVYHAALAIALGGWALLMFDNDDWSFLTFVLFAVCFSADRWLGLTLAAAVAVVWTAAWAVTGKPFWILPVPLAVFVVGAVLAVTLYRTEVTKQRQADLIRQLTATRQELALSERSKGILEERARFASEIHDTLAQGFASIVLVSRAALRTGETDEALASNEATALENLDAARRLIEASRPVELEAASLPDALRRQINNALPAQVKSQFQVVGQPSALPGTIEVTLLRATQEALLNIANHAHAQHVNVTLSYLEDVVALDVRDDGIGFEPGTIHDRGQLTGGQGLQALKQRAQSLSGKLTIEAVESGGSVVSILLPASS